MGSSQSSQWRKDFTTLPRLRPPGRMLCRITQSYICGPAPCRTKNSTTSAGITGTPASAKQAPWPIRGQSGVRAKARRKTSSAAKAKTSAAANRLDFIDTLKASPSSKPAPNSRAAPSRPVTSTVSVSSQMSVHNSSVRNSMEVRKYGGHSAANTAVHSAVRAVKKLRAIFHTHQIVAAMIGIIATRMRSTMSACTPSALKSGAHSAWKTGVWLSKTSR